MNKLQKALKVNALFSSVSGLLLILLNTFLAELFNTENTTVFWVVGIVLLYFATTIWYEIKKQRKLAVQWIIIQDLLWVVGSLILIVFNPFSISLIGNVIIILIALIVLFMAVNQYNSLSNHSSR